MDIPSSKTFHAVLFLGIATVFAALFTWQFDVIVPAIEANYFLFQLILGATIIALFRTEVGLSTFGVFAPIIIAFAWLEIGAVWGILFITYLFLIAVATRLSIERFGLSTPHRVAVSLTMVSFGLFALGAISQTQPSMPQFRPVLLFPAVITAWYGERFTNQVQADGWPSAGKRLGWTIFVVLLAFIVITYRPLVEWFAHTPLSWVALLALHLGVGARGKFRLTEYFRFGTLRRSFAGGDAPQEVLTMRVRNREFISRYNPRYLLETFDKLMLKRTLSGLDIPTPGTYLLLATESDLDDFANFLDEHDAFALKPTSGSGGRGILVVNGRDGETFRTSRGPMSATEIHSRARDIVDGRYERGYAVTGNGYVESLIRPGSVLSEISETGVPDLRIIVLRGVPVMAMARIPTKESHGSANLHGGAVGVAVGISDGSSRGAYQQTHDRWLETHPDTGADLDFEIDDWNTVLELASKAATATHLGYAGVDIVFDRETGPTVLEVNRRPGLGIQNVNLSGLLTRLRVAERELDRLSFKSPTERVAAAQEWDAANWEVTTDA